MDKGAGVLYIEVSNIKLKRYEKSLDKNLLFCANIFPKYKDRAIYRGL